MQSQESLKVEREAKERSGAGFTKDSTTVIGFGDGRRGYESRNAVTDSWTRQEQVPLELLKGPHPPFPLTKK